MSIYVCGHIERCILARSKNPFLEFRNFFSLPAIEFEEAKEYLIFYGFQGLVRPDFTEIELEKWMIIPEIDLSH